ncbi:MAG: PilZ domain-containing protein [Acidobacteriota bacterium]
MKRLAELTVADLVASPVWRYEGGSGASARVAATDRQTLLQADDEVFLAATDFELADASRHFGFCFPADDSGIDYLQPVIVHGARHVSFWFDGPVTLEALASQWKTLGRAPERIFPVLFRCLVPVDGREVSGRITGVETSQGVAAGWPASPPAAEAEGVSGTPNPTPALAARPVEARRRGTGAVEKRTARRRKTEMTVEFSQDSFQGRGITGDISRRGMFVRTPQIPGTGPALKLTVHLPDGRELILRGRVVRTAAEPVSASGDRGFGLRLADDSPEFDELLSKLRRRSE